MANRTRCWIFDLKLYLFKIYMLTQPWAVLMHNFNLNVSLCADLIRTVFSPIFIALILKGIWTKRNKDILMVHMAREGNIVIVLKKILIRWFLFNKQSHHINLSSDPKGRTAKMNKKRVQPTRLSPVWSDWTVGQDWHNNPICPMAELLNSSLHRL